MTIIARSPADESFFTGAPFINFPQEKDVTEGKLEDIKKSGDINRFVFETGDAAGEQVSRNVCPLAAHIRKTNPRATQVSSDVNRRILRHGIPYGDERGPSETATTTPKVDRGLLFACYQSSIKTGYQFIQQSWLNNPSFPAADAGFDPFAAQPPGKGLLTTTLFAAAKTGTQTSTRLPKQLDAFEKLVTMRGGQYFFVPSISALRDTLGST